MTFQWLVGSQCWLSTIAEFTVEIDFHLGICQHYLATNHLLDITYTIYYPHIQQICNTITNQIIIYIYTYCMKYKHISQNFVILYIPPTLLHNNNNHISSKIHISPSLAFFPKHLSYYIYIYLPNKSESPSWWLNQPIWKKYVRENGWTSSPNRRWK